MRDYSIVMSVYRNDDPAHFRDAVTSAINQTIPARELILVVDGPVGGDLDAAIDDIKALFPVRLFHLPKNVGLGAARHHGIAEAKYDLIGVMDSDDICLPDRFARQIDVLDRGQADIVGGWIEEFDERPGDAHRVRTVPTLHDDIVRYGKWRNPMNHVTIMFKKEAYEEAGGYRRIPYFEDYDLFVRMINSGARFSNLPEVLVLVRCGKKMFGKRGGLHQAGVELRFLWSVYRSGYTSFCQFAANAFIRVPIRLVPSQLRRWFYLRCLRRAPFAKAAPGA